ncbi:MAG: TRAP transporter permease [Longimicrobiales bacterium]
MAERESGVSTTIPPPERAAPTPALGAVSDEAAVGGGRVLSGYARLVVATFSVLLSIYALYWVIGVVETRAYRISFLLLVLVLAFLMYGARAGAGAGEPRVGWQDWLLAALSVIALGWPLLDLAAFPYRAATPNGLDLALGALTVVLVLEATRRAIGWMLPLTALAALVYAYVGPVLELIGLGAIAHRGYYLDRLIGTQYMTLEGIFGVPLDVAATYIILFTIFGAVLERSGAAHFYIDWAMALTGRAQRGSGPGRTLATAGFLLGTVSGSGVATTVTLGSVGWPLLRRARYPADTAGAVLAAAGIGAIMAPPTMGAAAFLIAEFLQISYLEVIRMALIPAALYYAAIFLMIEADARRLGTAPVAVGSASLAQLTSSRGHLFLPLIAIVALLVAGLTAFRAVFWATVLAFALSWLRAESALGPRRLVAALEAGGKGVVAVAATTATAGIIVGVVTLTGLGLKLSGILVGLGGGNALGTVLLAAAAVWLLGLAVPVTASYIIAAVMIAPALVTVGVPIFAAHMFIFYYAVLSEVSPPTALSPFAAAAITGGNPFRTMMLTWKYTLPAFLVPFIFTVGEGGVGLLMHGSVGGVARITASAALGVAAFAAGFGGWIRGAATPWERATCVAAGLLLFLAGGWTDALGAALLAAVAALHWRRQRSFSRPAAGRPGAASRT